MKISKKADNLSSRLLLFTFLLLSTVTFLSAQSYQLVATGPPSIQSKANDVELRFLPNNQIEYYIPNGQYKGWVITYEWGAPQITYQPDGQVLSLDTRGWVVSAGPPQRGATISVTFQGLTNNDRLINPGRAFAGFSGTANRYVSTNNTAQIRMTQWDEPEITATVYLSDGAGTNVILATYSFRRTDVSTASSVTVNPPEITHNIMNQGEYWMNIKPTGWLSGYQGRKVQLVTRFYYSNETPLYASTQNPKYRDVSGLVATATEVIDVNLPTLDLSQHIMTIPYRVLNLPHSGGQASYNLFLFIDIFVDGQLVKQSDRVPFTVKW